jgi:hypothetical protein
MKNIFAGTAFILAAVLLIENAAAQQSQTCSQVANRCLQLVQERNAGKVAEVIKSRNAECTAARASCIQTGTWHHNNAYLTNLQKR